MRDILDKLNPEDYAVVVQTGAYLLRIRELENQVAELKNLTAHLYEGEYNVNEARD